MAELRKHGPVTYREADQEYFAQAKVAHRAGLDGIRLRLATAGHKPARGLPSALAGSQRAHDPDGHPGQASPQPPFPPILKDPGLQDFPR